MAEQINPFEGHAESTVPFLLCQFDNVFADRDPGTIAENVDVAPVSHGRFDCATAVDGAANVTLQEEATASLLFYLRSHLRSFPLIHIQHSDAGAHFGQAVRDAAPYAGRATGDGRNLALQRQQLCRTIPDFSGDGHPCPGWLPARTFVPGVPPVHGWNLFFAVVASAAGPCLCSA